MKDAKQMIAKKTWTAPVIKAIDLTLARGGASGSADHVPGGHS
jgi:hypothetical protein